jgi:hypothetical protein
MLNCDTTDRPNGPMSRPPRFGRHSRQSPGRRPAIRTSRQTSSETVAGRLPAEAIEAEVDRNADKSMAGSAGRSTPAGTDGAILPPTPTSSPSAPAATSGSSSSTAPPRPTRSRRDPTWSISQAPRDQGVLRYALTAFHSSSVSMSPIVWQPLQGTSRPESQMPSAGLRSFMRSRSARRRRPPRPNGGTRRLVSAPRPGPWPSRCGTVPIG